MHGSKPTHENAKASCGRRRKKQVGRGGEMFIIIRGRKSGKTSRPARRWVRGNVTRLVRRFILTMDNPRDVILTIDAAVGAAGEGAEVEG
jgi:hypothetical protein